LSKSEKRAIQNGDDTFGLHSFPDIADNELTSVRRCLPSDEDFKRLKYNQFGTNRIESTSGSDDGGTCIIRKGSVSTAQLNEQAYQKGFADGRRKGEVDAEKAWHALGEKKIEPVLTSLQEILIQLNSFRKEIYQETEKEVVELSLAIARQIICQEVSFNRDIVTCVAREALAKVEEPGNIKIKMSPSDLKFIKETRSQMSKLIENIDNVTLEAEENIQNGGCVIETDLGEVDARIE